jgi:hypothetical protein
VLVVLRAWGPDSSWRETFMTDTAEIIFCVASLFFLAWVIYLKMQIAALTEQSKKMAGLLKMKVDQDRKDFEGAGDKAVWGKRPSWLG